MCNTKDYSIQGITVYKGLQYTRDDRIYPAVLTIHQWNVKRGQPIGRGFIRRIFENNDGWLLDYSWHKKNDWPPFGVVLRPETGACMMSAPSKQTTTIPYTFCAQTIDTILLMFHVQFHRHWIKCSLLIATNASLWMQAPNLSLLNHSLIDYQWFWMKRTFQKDIFCNLNLLKYQNIL